MKKRMLMILITFLVVNCNLTVLSEITVEDIFSKLEQNYGAIQDMEFTEVEKSVMGTRAEISSESKIYLKRPDKLRIEKKGETNSFTVFNGNYVSTVIDGKEVKKDKVTKRSIAKYYKQTWAIVRELENNYESEIDYNNSNVNDGIYMIETINANQKGIKLFPKIRILVDYDKGVELKVESFNKRNKCVMSQENSGFVNINGIWVINETETTMHYYGITLKTKTTISGIKVNNEMSDSIFIVK